MAFGIDPSNHNALSRKLRYVTRERPRPISYGKEIQQREKNSTKGDDPNLSTSTLVTTLRKAFARLFQQKIFSRECKKHLNHTFFVSSFWNPSVLSRFLMEESTS